MEVDIVVLSRMLYMVGLSHKQSKHASDIS